MDIADFAEQYRSLPDEELLRIHFDSEQLTDDARSALSTEMHARGLDTREKIAEFRKQEQLRRKDDELERVRFDARKIGRTAYGKSDREYNAETGIEEYTTTLFLNFSGLPLIPTGSYRVEKKRGWRYDYRILKKLPLDWRQVARMWLLSATLIAAAVLVFVILDRLRANR